jgi:hypothetical protein
MQFADATGISRTWEAHAVRLPSRPGPQSVRQSAGNFKRRWPCPTILALCAILAFGCSPAKTKVRGRVTFEGTPPPEIQVRLDATCILGSSDMSASWIILTLP